MTSEPWSSTTASSIGESACDLHVHSRFSSDPGEWILRQIGARESYVDPLDVYEAAKSGGMDYVTISDHDCIDGALELSHLEDAFNSSETTVFFPEDGCKIHVLVSGVTPDEFREIDRRRHDVYEFQQYVFETGVFHSVAHPLFRVNDRLTVDHVEKILLLFERFEIINGSRDARAMEIASAVFHQLTPAAIEGMARRQRIEPVGKTPWRKQLTGGSDDHSGLYVASAYTRTPPAANVSEFLDHLRAGRHDAGGSHGNSLRLAHSFLNIAQGYEAERFGARNGDAPRALADLLDRLTAPAAGRSATSYGVQLGARGRSHDPSANNEPRQDRAACQANDDQVFQATLEVGQELACEFAGTLLSALASGSLFGAGSAGGPLASYVMTLLPYVAAFRTQHKDEAFLRDAARAFIGRDPAVDARAKRLWLSDAYNEVNGVTTTIRTLAETAERRRKPLLVGTCLEDLPSTDFDVVNFQAQVCLPVPAYPGLTLAAPSPLEVVQYIERENIGQIIVSAPGPLGLIGLLASRMLERPIYGVYHTDLPGYARRLTGDVRMEQLMWRVLRWFYSHMEKVFVPSEYYRRRLVENGFDPSNLRLLTRGVDVERFNPLRRVEGFWQSLGLDQTMVLLYVGRVSSEKNVELLLDSFRQFTATGRSAGLAIVGDGPLRQALQVRHKDLPVVFSGPLAGDDLSAAYASSDLFVFPSTTDTFGNVVLEALASGLPAIVSDRGGPMELITPGTTGFVVPVDKPGALQEAFATAYDERGSLAVMRRHCLALARSRTWESVFRHLWKETGPSAAPSATNDAADAAPPARWGHGGLQLAQPETA